MANEDIRSSLRQRTVAAEGKVPGWREPAHPAYYLAAALILSALLHVAGAVWLSDTLLFGRAPLPNRAKLEVALALRVPTGGALTPLSTGVAPTPSSPSPAAADPAATGVRAANLGTSPSFDPHLPPHEGAEHRPNVVSPFLPPEEVERAAYPLSSPDLSPFQVVKTYSGMPIRLRLFVDAHGNVVDVKILHALDVDDEAAALLVQIWERVGFVPARRAGAEVASFQDVEFQLTDKTGEIIVR